MELRSRLKNLSKEGLTVSQYVGKEKNISDHLAVAGKPIQSKDLFLHVLRGLGPNYNSFVALMNMRET